MIILLLPQIILFYNLFYWKKKNFNLKIIKINIVKLLIKSIYINFIFKFLI